MNKLNTSKDLVPKEIFNIIFGISNEYKISKDRLAKIIHIPADIIDNWYKQKEIILTSNTSHILDFIDLYNCLSSYFTIVEDQIKWLNTINQKFNNCTPFNFIENDFNNIQQIINHLEKRMRGY